MFCMLLSLLVKYLRGVQASPISGTLLPRSLLAPPLATPAQPQHCGRLIALLYFDEGPVIDPIMEVSKSNQLRT
jgi:hypothetical protein